MQDNSTGMTKAKKDRTPERQAEIMERVKEKHRAQAEIEPAVMADINAKADQAIKIYKTKKDFPESAKDKIKAEIINRMANGQSLTNICNKIDYMPAPKTVLEWVEKDPLFGRNYAHARLQQADVLFNQCLDIAVTRQDDVLDDGAGKKIINHAAIQRDRLMIETRFRMAGKLSAKYADKSALLGEGASVTVNNLSIDPRAMTPDNRDKLRRLLIEAKASVQDKG